MAEKVLITGGAGFVGSHLADALLQRGYGVRVFDNLTPQVHNHRRPEYLSKDVEFVPGDMRDEEAVKRVVEGVDVVFHLAAAVGVGQSMYEIAHYMGSNTQGTAILLQALLSRRSELRKLVVASSMSIYGEGSYHCAKCGPLAPSPREGAQLEQKRWEIECPHCGSTLSPAATRESKPLQATSIYALSKRNQEEMCLLFGRTYGLPVAALRYFNIYGTRQALSNPYTGVAAIFASRLLNKRPPVIFEDGQQMRDFVSVRDIVQGNLLAMTSTQGNGLAINIGSGDPISIKAIADTLSRVLDIQILPEITARYRAGDIRHCYADITLAKQCLGYEPKVSFEVGMAELGEWLRAQEPPDNGARAAAQLTAFGLTM